MEEYKPPDPKGSSRIATAAYFAFRPEKIAQRYGNRAGYVAKVRRIEQMTIRQALAAPPKRYSRRAAKERTRRATQRERVGANGVEGICSRGVGARGGMSEAVAQTPGEDVTLDRLMAETIEAIAATASRSTVTAAQRDNGQECQRPCISPR